MDTRPVTSLAVPASLVALLVLGGCGDVDQEAAGADPASRSVSHGSSASTSGVTPSPHPGTVVGTCAVDGPIYASVDEALEHGSLTVLGTAGREGGGLAGRPPVPLWRVMVEDALGAGDVGEDVLVLARDGALVDEPCLAMLEEGQRAVYVLTQSHSRSAGRVPDVEYFPVAVYVEEGESFVDMSQPLLADPVRLEDLRDAAEADNLRHAP